MVDLNVTLANTATDCSTGDSAGREQSIREDCLNILAHEIGFVFNVEFETLTHEEVLAAANRDELYQVEETSEASDSRGPSYFAALHAIALLSKPGEAALFRKMNFLKYWANVFRSTLDPDRPSAEKINEIRHLLQQAEQTRNTIVESNLRLVVSIARKFSSNRIAFEELVSEGNTILLKAVEKFDYSRGYRFSTYLTHSVQRHFYRYFQRSQRRKKKEVAVQGIEQTPAHAPDEEELALCDPAKADKLLSRMSDCLDSREQLIVLRRCGVGTQGQVSTYQKLGDELGLSKERVRQLFHIAVDKLRQLAAELKLDLAPSL